VRLKSFGKNGKYRFSEHLELHVPRLNDRLPNYRLHRRSGQAIVTLNGRDHYLGRHGSDASRREYDRLIAQWPQSGRNSAPATDHQPAEQAGSEHPATSNSIDQVIHAFWKNAQVHYRKPDGSLTSEIDYFRQSLRPLRRLYGQTLACQFGPKALKVVRDQMIGLGWCRSNINKQISRVKSVFRWAVENELVPPSIFHGLLAVKCLQQGRTNAVESKPVRPVPEASIRWHEVKYPAWGTFLRAAVTRLVVFTLDTMSGDSQLRDSISNSYVTSVRMIRP
jgi:hypothetical protein